MSFLKQTSITLVTRFVLVVVSFMYNIILSRKLGTAGMDIIAPLQSFAMIAVQIGYLGLERGAIYYIGLDKNRASIIAGTMMTVGLIASLIVYAGLTVAANIFPSMLGGIDITLYHIQLISIAPLLISLYAQNLLLAHQEITKYNVIEISIRIANLIATILVFQFADSSVWIPAMVWLYVASSVAMAIFNGGAVWMAKPFGLAIEWKALKEMFAYSWKHYYSSLMAFMIVRSDILFLNAYRVNTDEAGIYSRVVYISDFMHMIPVTIGLLLFPKLMQDGASEESGLDDRGRFTMMLTRLVTFVLFVMWIIFFLIGKWFLGIFGEGFDAGYWPMVILLAGIIFIGSHAILKVELFRRGLPVFIVVYTTIGMLVKIAGNIALVPKYGMYGAAWSSLAVHAIFFAMALWYCVRHYGFSVGKTLFLCRDDLRLLWNRMVRIFTRG